MKPLFTTLLILFAIAASGQAKLIINGGIINIKNSAVLVISNPDNSAITRTGSGYIISEGENNRIIWAVGAGNTQTYTVPFGNSSSYLPLSFSASSGSANGQMIFSTYPTPTWKNSDYLPSGVTNVNSTGIDNSTKVIDRFWQITPQGYMTKPTLSNLIFTYSDAELLSPNNIAEANMIPQRWNNVLLRWDDYFPSSIIDVNSNTATIAAVPGNQLFNWWTMSDASSPLPVTLINFKAVAAGRTVITSWQTASESNSSHFEIWRKSGRFAFDSIGRVAAAGNSPNLLDYSYTDLNPYTGDLYYRLKMVDKDGRFKWSEIVQVVIGDQASVLLYPNPATDKITLSAGGTIMDKKPIVFIYDARGSLRMSFKITDASQQVYLDAFDPGVYFVKICYENEFQVLRFIKK